MKNLLKWKKIFRNLTLQQLIGDDVRLYDIQMPREMSGVTTFTHGWHIYHNGFKFESTVEHGIEMLSSDEGEDDLYAILDKTVLDEYIRIKTL